MSDWLLDVGNTHLKLAAGDAPQRPVLLAWSDASEDALRRLFEPLRPADRMAWCSVVDETRGRTLRVLLAAREVRIDAPRVLAQAAGIRTDYDTHLLGVDRWLQLIAARALSARAQLVVSLGSAMTVDWLDAQGRHRGGWIVPRAARIAHILRADFPTLQLEAGVDRGFGLRSADAACGGIAAQERGLLREAIAMVEAASGHAPALCFCGGGGADLAAAFDAPHHPWLALMGLAQWADWTRAQRAGQENGAG